MPRAKSYSFKIDDPCPCVSSNRTLRFCCLTVDGHLRKHVPSLDPPSPKTNFSRAGCYRASTNDCSDSLTGEHYVSKGVLEELAGGIEIKGMPWLATNESKRVGINSFVLNILCERHNSALHHLDDEAKAFFRFFKGLSEDIGTTSLSRKGTNRLVSGELMELWLLKVACGITLSFATANGVRLKNDHVFDLEKVNRAFSHNVWDRGAGMYLRAPTGSSFPQGIRYRSHPSLAIRKNASLELEFGCAACSLIWYLIRRG